MNFDGATFSEEEDGARLSTQLERVLELMKDENWRTIHEIAKIVEGSEASVSARLRDLRKPKFGSYVVCKRQRGTRSDGLFEYQILPPGSVSKYDAAKKDSKHGFYLAGLVDSARLMMAADPGFRGTKAAVALRDKIKEVKECETL